ncbi:MAG: DNA repair protein RadC [Nitrospira sp.]
MTPCAIPRYTIELVRDPTSPYTTSQSFISPQHTFAYLKPILEDQDREHMYGVFLDTKHRIIGMHHIAMGSMNQAIIHPREVFKCAILLNAAALVIAHNHPSGDPTPSAEDRLLTKRLADAGEILGITLLDHLVIGDNRFYSFADHGRLLDL